MIICLHINFLLSYISKIILKWVPQEGTRCRPPRTTSYCIFPLTSHRTHLDPVLPVREIRAQKVEGRSWKIVWFQALNNKLHVVCHQWINVYISLFLLSSLSFLFKKGLKVWKNFFAFLYYSLDRVIPPSSTALWLYAFVVWLHSFISSWVPNFLFCFGCTFWQTYV